MSYFSKFSEKISGLIRGSDGCEHRSSQPAPSRSPSVSNGSLWPDDMELEDESSATMARARGPTKTSPTRRPAVLQHGVAGSGETSGQESQRESLNGSDISEGLESLKLQSTTRRNRNSSLGSSASSDVSSRSTVNSQVLNDDAASASAATDPDVIRETGIGVIGAMDRGEGIIDNKFRFRTRDFPEAKVNGKFMFKFGDRVEFVAEQRLSKSVHFRVTSMKHHVPAKDLQMYENLKCSMETGNITKVAVDGSVFVLCNNDKDMTIRVEPEKLQEGIDFEPGDWLKLKVTYGELDQATGRAEVNVLSSEPLSVTETSGAKLMRTHYPKDETKQNMRSHIRSGMVWCINKKIIADDKLVRKTISGNQLHGLIVNVTAIESNQGIYKYRAIRLSRVEPHLAYRLRQLMPKEHSLTKEQHEFYQNMFKNKKGIVIEPLKFIDFGNVLLQCWKEKSFTVKNTSSTESYLLKDVTLNYEQSVAKFELQLPKAEAEDYLVILVPGQTLTIKIKATPIEWGRTYDMITFEFKGFTISRDLKMYGHSPDTQEDKAIEDSRSSRGCGHERQECYVKGQRNEKQRKYNENADMKKQLGSREVTRGGLAIRPPFFGQKTFQLDNYDIPAPVAEAHREAVTTALYKRFPSLRCTEEFYATKPEILTLTPENYSDCFQAGLWLEEIESEIRLNELAMKGVRLYREADDFMYFHAPYYEPSQTQIQLGMTFFVFDEADPTQPKHKSSIVKIESGCIYGRFSKDFMHNYKDQPMSVRYEISRTTYRRWHFAATQAMDMLGSDWLFPQKLQVRAPRVRLVERMDDADDEEEEPAMEKQDDEEQTSEAGGERSTNANATLESPKQEEKEKGTRSQVRMNPDKFKSLQRNRQYQNELDFRMKSTFPASVTRKSVDEILEKDVKLRWFNKLLNTEQKDAVRRILKGQCRPHPFIIYGPPGTGKTVTMVEAILQVNKFFKNSRILVTAPTNAAADLITEYLVDSGRFLVGDITRLLGFQRRGALMPQKIALYCSDAEKLDHVAKSSIVITTTNSAALLFGAGLKEDNFSYVFIDEAGCCFEPDGLLPALLVNVHGHGQLIMAGDHKQLGPHVYSTNAKFYGLGISLLQRFMETKLYSTASTDGILVTKLVKNYRSHATILKIPSQLFYRDELDPQAPEEETTKLLERLEQGRFSLPNPKAPLWFYGHAANENRDTHLNSYSWYNDAEVRAVVDIVRNLIGCGCVPADIGVITPYRRQADKIRLRIGELGCDVPKVGTVEVFQGDERKIIILSLVRSDITDEGYMMSKLWFVFSEERTNVMLTRARCLQIVVGNPQLFCKSPIWKSYIEHCITLGAYDGCPLPTYLNPKFHEMFKQYQEAEREPEALQPATSQNYNNVYQVPLFEPEW